MKPTEKKSPKKCKHNRDKKLCCACRYKNKEKKTFKNKDLVDNFKLRRGEKL